MNRLKAIRDLISEAFENMHGNSGLVALQPLFQEAVERIGKGLTREEFVAALSANKEFELVDVCLPRSGETATFVKDIRQLNSIVSPLVDEILTDSRILNR